MSESSPLLSLSSDQIRLISNICGTPVTTWPVLVGQVAGVLLTCYLTPPSQVESTFGNFLLKSQSSSSSSSSLPPSSPSVSGSSTDWNRHDAVNPRNPQAQVSTTPGFSSAATPTTPSSAIASTGIGTYSPISAVSATATSAPKMATAPSATPPFSPLQSLVPHKLVPVFLSNPPGTAQSPPRPPLQLVPIPLTPQSIFPPTPQTPQYQPYSPHFSTQTQNPVNGISNSHQAVVPQLPSSFSHSRSQQLSSVPVTAAASAAAIPPGGTINTFAEYVANPGAADNPAININWKNLLQEVFQNVMYKGLALKYSSPYYLTERNADGNWKVMVIGPFGDQASMVTPVKKPDAEKDVARMLVRTLETRKFYPPRTVELRSDWSTFFPNPVDIWGDLTSSVMKIASTSKSSSSSSSTDAQSPISPSAGGSLPSRPLITNCPSGTIAPNVIYSPNAIYIPGVNPKTGVVHKIEESATSAVVYVDSDSCPILTPSRVASFSTVSFRLFASKNGKGLAHMRFLVDVNVGPNVDMCKCPESGTDFMILMMLSEVCVELYLRAAKYSRPLVTKPLNPLVVIVSEHFWFHMLHKMMRPWVMVVRSWDELSNVLVEKPKFLLPAESETTNQGYNAPNMMR